MAAETSPVLYNPLLTHRLAVSSVEMPDPIEFVISDKYLDRGVLYPRQATALKVIFLRDDLFTDYDHEVISGWEETFRRTGNEGISPGIMDRIAYNKAQGRSWFREVLAVIGRRGGKGHLGAIAGAYILWHFLNRPGGPQVYYGIDRDKTLSAIVFAGKKEQAKANQWGDLSKFIIAAPCFRPYLSKPLGEQLTVYSPADLLKMQRQKMERSRIETDQATFSIVPSASTMMAGRGPASFMLFFDEMAHIVASGASRSAEEIYNAAAPSLDQFGKDGFIYAGSSPWQMQGKFYQLWENAIALEPDGSPSYPAMMMLQLPSWGPYEDWERAHEISYRPGEKKWIEVSVPVTLVRDGEEFPSTRAEVREVTEPGPTLPRIRSAVQVYDEDMRKKERANPDSFAVENRSHWAHSLSSYLDEKKVSQAFAPWNERTAGDPTLVMQAKGPLSKYYKAHADPGHVNDNFAFAMGHVEHVEGDRYPHVVIDLLRWWRPVDFPDGMIDYPSVTEDLQEIIRVFTPDELTFDQFQSVMMISTLRTWVAKSQLPKVTNIFEKPATRPLNWSRAELFKSALNLGLVHIPMHNADGSVNDASEMAELEMRFLELKSTGKVEHPTSGPVQHDDLYSCLSEVVWALIGEDLLALLESPVMTQVGGTAPGGIIPSLPTTSGQDPFRALGAVSQRRPSPGGMGAARGGGMRRR